VSSPLFHRCERYHPIYGSAKIGLLGEDRVKTRRLLDAHVHFWDPNARHHEWLAEAPALHRRFGPEDLEAQGRALSGVVFVQADCRDEEALDEVHWVQELAAEQPLIRGIVAYAPLHLGVAAASHLRALAGEPLVVGVRRLLQGRPAETILAPELITGVRMLAAWDLTFDLCATHDQLPQVGGLVRACPETRFVLDHLGKPAVRTGALDPWRADLEKLAALPNVVCKLSGLATEAAPGRGADDARPYLAYALETFGPRRCMVASDWPVVTIATTVAHWFDVVLEVIAELTPADQDAVLEGTAAATYGLAL
jgi:L-fuconolactonase